MPAGTRVNPYLIIGAMLAIAASFFCGDYVGHGRGIDEQKVSDQREFDRISAEIMKQKAEASALYRQAQADIIALQVERDRLKNELEAKREIDRKATDDRRTEFAGRGLRFNPIEDPRAREDGGGPQGAGSNPASPVTPTALELPASLTASLRLLAFDADKLADDYRECYGYAVKVR